MLLGVSAVLVILFGATILALDQTFERSTDEAIRALLDAQLLGLIALAEEDPVRGLTLPDETAAPKPETDLNTSLKVTPTTPTPLPVIPPKKDSPE